MPKKQRSEKMSRDTGTARPERAQGLEHLIPGRQRERGRERVRETSTSFLHPAALWAGKRAKKTETNTASSEKTETPDLAEMDGWFVG